MSTTTAPTGLVRTTAIRRRTSRSTPRWVLISAEILVPIALLAWWWIASASSTNTFFPPLQIIVEQLIALTQTPQFVTDISSSVGNLLVSFALASLFGVVLGSLIGLYRPLSWLMEPTLHFFRAIPPVALVPIFVSLIGFGNETRIVSITLASLFPTLIATIDGVRGTEPTLGMVSRVFRFDWVQRFFQVVLPAASPRILSGMQVSLMTAFIVMIASEMLGSSTGLGAATLLAQQSFAIADMWAGILLLGVLGYAATALFDLFRRWILKWYIASQQMEREL